MADSLPFPMRKKREPKIVVFEEPKPSKQIKLDVKKRKRKLDDNPEEEEGEDFISIAREVKDFGVTGFTKKEQKKDKQKYAEHLGAHKQKAVKCPYPLLMERIKQRKEKESKQRELEQAVGIFKKKQRQSENVTQKMNLGRWVDKSDLGKLRSRDTAMHIKKGEILKVQRSKK